MRLLHICFLLICSSKHVIASSSDSELLENVVVNNAEHGNNQFDILKNDQQETAPNDNQLDVLKNDPQGVECFILDVGAGNCVFLHSSTGTVVVDSGSSAVGYEDFSEKNRSVIEKCFSGINQVTFISTHIDQDHCNYIPKLAKFAVENNKSININFLVGGELNDETNIFYQDCSQACNKYPFNFIVHSTNKRQNINNIDEKQNKLPSLHLYNDGQTLCINYVEQMLKDTLGCIANFYILSPVNGLIKPESSNSQSIVLLFEHRGSTILFTGDATGDTLEAILGNRSETTTDTDEEILNLFLSGQIYEVIYDYDSTLRVISAVSKRNRRLLRNVNLLMIPHHGSDKDGCNLWLPKIIQMSKNKFCGCIVSANPLNSQYGHARHAAIDMIDFPQSARGIKKESISCTPFKGGNKPDRFVRKIKITTKNIFQVEKTGFCQVTFDNSGMKICHKELQRLTTNGGFSLYNNHFWDLFVSEEESAIFILYGAFLANNNIFKMKDINGNLPIFLKLQELNEEQNNLFLYNVDCFLSSFELSQKDVFGAELQ